MFLRQKPEHAEQYDAQASHNADWRAPDLKWGAVQASCHPGRSLPIPVDRLKWQAPALSTHNAPVPARILGKLRAGRPHFAKTARIPRVSGEKMANGCGDRQESLSPDASTAALPTPFGG